MAFLIKLNLDDIWFHDRSPILFDIILNIDFTSWKLKVLSIVTLIFDNIIRRSYITDNPRNNIPIYIYVYMWYRKWLQLCIYIL